MSFGKSLKISLVIPIKDESDSLAELIESITQQTFQPDEIVLVDGGSSDNTIEIAEWLSAKNSKLKLIKTPKAAPGKGRNIGIKNSKNDWIAMTDAGIKLEKNWLEKLVEKINENPEIDIVYGNYSPVIKSYFEKIAALCYVPAQNENVVRGKTVVSYLIRKAVWKTVGGFPDLRAAEDLMFMEAAEGAGFQFTFAPEAMVYWQLRPDLTSTFRKFVLYSKHNVWANRQWDWHYGIAKQYLFVLPFILLAVFYSPWWLVGVLIWLIARTIKRILPHRFEFGLKPVFNPIYFFSIMFLILTIDLATFIGWGQAIISPKS